MSESFLNKVAGNACNLPKKETLVHVFSCEFCEIFKSTIFTEHLWVTAFKKMGEEIKIGDIDQSPRLGASKNNGKS